MDYLNIPGIPDGCHNHQKKLNLMDSPTKFLCITYNLKISQMQISRHCTAPFQNQTDCNVWNNMCHKIRKYEEIPLKYIFTWLSQHIAISLSLPLSHYISPPLSLVRFPADADICSSDSCLKWRSRMLCPVLSARKRSQCLNLIKDVWLSPLS